MPGSSLNLPNAPVGLPAIRTVAAISPDFTFWKPSAWPMLTSSALMPSSSKMSRVENCVPLPTSLKLTFLPAEILEPVDARPAHERCISSL